MNSKWNVPQPFISAYPTLKQKLSSTTIPLIPKDDKLIWKNSHDGSLTFKDAYIFHASNHSRSLSWAKMIWNVSIAPSKSFLVFGDYFMTNSPLMTISPQEDAFYHPSVIFVVLHRNPLYTCSLIVHLKLTYGTG